MKKNSSLSISLLLSISGLMFVPGCVKKDKNDDGYTRSVVENVRTEEVDMRMAESELSEETMRSFFDLDTLEEFAAYADDENGEDLNIEDIAWREIDEDDSRFASIYFDYDKYGVRQDQEGMLKADIEQIKREAEEARAAGLNPTFVIEGHSCQAGKGSAPYNVALSEKRAKIIADRLVEAGISRDNIKVVGRGREVPAVDDAPRERDAQWVNRRVEVHAIYS